MLPFLFLAASEALIKRLLAPDLWIAAASRWWPRITRACVLPGLFFFFVWVFFFGFCFLMFFVWCVLGVFFKLQVIGCYFWGLFLECWCFKGSLLLLPWVLEQIQALRKTSGSTYCFKTNPDWGRGQSQLTNVLERLQTTNCYSKVKFAGREKSVFKYFVLDLLSNIY